MKVECKHCLEKFEEGDIFCGLCKSCAHKVLRQFVYFLKNEFDDAGREYLDACTDGLLLAEPQSLLDYEFFGKDEGDELSFLDRIRNYEQEKKILQSKGLSAEQYEQEINKLATKYKI